MENVDTQPKLERLSYYKQALSNFNHTKQMLFEVGLIDNDLRLQLIALENNLAMKIKTLESDIKNGLIF